MSTFSSLIGAIIVNIIVNEICLAYQFVIVFLLYIFFDLKLLSLQLWNFFLCKDEINSNPNIVSTLVAPSQASFVTSIKSFGQPLINQQNNSGFIMAPRLPTRNYMLASAVGSLLISPYPPISKSMSMLALRTALWTTMRWGPLEILLDP